MASKIRISLRAWRTARAHNPLKAPYGARDSDEHRTSRRQARTQAEAADNGRIQPRAHGMPRAPLEKSTGPISSQSSERRPATDLGQATRDSLIGFRKRPCKIQWAWALPDDSLMGLNVWLR